MAESTLSLTYSDFRREVAVLLGWQRDPADWNNTQALDFQDLSERAQRQFYFPATGNPEEPIYEWTFLRKAGSISLATGDFDYDMADDFSGTILDRSLSYPSGNGNRPPKKISEQDIRQLQSVDSRTGYPKYYAIRNKAHSYTAGQRYEMLVYPTPTAADGNGVALSFRYVFTPNTVGTTNVYPVGGARYSEVLLASYLAAAEWKMDDDPNGAFTLKFKEMLESAIRVDKESKSNDRGGLA